MARSQRGQPVNSGHRLAAAPRCGRSVAVLGHSKLIRGGGVIIPRRRSCGHCCARLLPEFRSGLPGRSLPSSPGNPATFKFNFRCGLVRFGVLGSARSRMESLFSSLKSGFISRNSYISWFKIISPPVRSKLEMIHGFLVSLLNGFRFPLLPCCLCD